MSRIHSGGIVPLFDRLGSELDNIDGIEKNFLTPIGLEQSVMIELNRLSTTRSRLTFDEFVKNDLTVLDYGLPDFTGYSVQNDENRRAVKVAIVKAIENYEPRLKKINVSVFTTSTKKNVSFFVVEASLLLGKEYQRVSFTLNGKNSPADSLNQKEVF